MHEHLVVWYTFFVPYFILQLMKLGLGFAGIASSSWQRPLGLFAEDRVYGWCALIQESKSLCTLSSLKIMIDILWLEGDQVSAPTLRQSRRGR